MTVVHNREVRRPLRPERLGVRQVDPALRREPGVSEPVSADEPGDVEGRLEVLRPPDLLHDLESPAHADDLGATLPRLDLAGHLPGITACRLEADEARGGLHAYLQPGDRRSPDGDAR